MTIPAPSPGADPAVLMISLSDAILTGAGGGDVRERHLDYANRLKHLHMVVQSPRSRYLSETALSPQLTVYPTGSRHRLLFALDAYRLGARLCRTQPINVITTQDPFLAGLVGLLLKLRFSLPLDVQNHSGFPGNRVWLRERPLRNHALNGLARCVVLRADALRVLTAVDAAYYARLGIPADRVQVQTIPIVLEGFTPEAPAGEQAALRSRLAIPADSPVILWAGRVVAFKRVPLLVQAFAQVREALPQAVLVLLGGLVGPEGRQVRSLLEKSGLISSVRVVDWVEHADLPAYYRLCSVYAHSSIYEGLGRVMIEAGACARPVVSTHTAGGETIVRDGITGLLCPVEDAGALARSLLTLLGDPTLAARMGAAARDHVTAVFDYHRAVQAITSGWARLAAQGQR